jgi:hypothetical protein
VQGIVNPANSIEHAEGGEPDLQIVAIPRGENQLVPQVAKPALDFWQCRLGIEP